LTPEQMVPVLTKHIPASGDRREDIWLEERYWGHRLWDQQSPWLVFLEFFSVAESAHHSGHLFNLERSLYPASYRPYARIHLRNILFNNEQQLQTIDETTSDSNAAWRTWLEWIERHSHGLDPDQRDFSYLKERFNSFHDFAKLVRALRSCTVEGHTNKRWSSRFLFPFGPAATYEDLKIVAEKPERDRINFGRTGELLYLMLSRSASRASLAEVFPLRVLDESNKWNHLVRQIQPPEATDDRRESKGKQTYLPYDTHPTFDVIADDWIALLDLRLPGFDVMPHLVTSGAFGILLYHLQTSAYLLNRDRKPDLICEIVAPRKGLVREQSVESFETNNALSVEAIDKLITNVESFDRWMEPGPAHEVLSRRREILKEEFSWDDEDAVTDPEDLLRRFREEAKGRHRRHFAHVHRSYGRGIGLVSRRGTNRFRYAPTDDFLKCLVFANVRKRTEFSEFLANLHARYGLVFGEREAATALDATDIDKKPFQANAQRLEHRLGSLGLLRRLSDACAFVENPYARA
jgi:hypothetical protein